jgi:hypothetical protein
VGAAHGAVGARSFPEAALRGAAGAGAGRLVVVLLGRPAAVAGHEEVPLALADARQARELPGVVAVQVHRGDDVELELPPVRRLLQVELQQLLLGGVEPEPRQVQLLRHGWIDDDDDRWRPVENGDELIEMRGKSRPGSLGIYRRGHDGVIISELIERVCVGMMRCRRFPPASCVCVAMQTKSRLAADEQVSGLT